MRICKKIEKPNRIKELVTLKEFKCESCLYSNCKNVKIVGTWGRTVTRLSVYCYKKSKAISKIIVRCEKYSHDPKKIAKVGNKRFKQDVLC